MRGDGGRDQKADTHPAGKKCGGAGAERGDSGGDSGGGSGGGAMTVRRQWSNNGGGNAAAVGPASGTRLVCRAVQWTDGCPHTAAESIKEIAAEG